MNGQRDREPFLTADPIALAQQLCDVFSVSGYETELVDRIEATVRIHARHLSLHRVGDTVVARSLRGKSKRVILAGHIDTVPVNGNFPSELRTDPSTGADILWGRGTVRRNHRRGM